MRSKKVTIINPTGLHARPAAEFNKTASQFRSEITVRKLGDDPQEGNGKSMINIMAMCLAQGTDIEIIAEGEDEMNAVETLTALIKSGFGEV
ncbi:HPr family phosphocarrier protein [Acetobacterium paludosum]|uniref:Phosphocarrier protein HPr n=1 Tax=Acetobacterium paludosum TaxID=52693 RepID=A0A923HVN4_9FIRM|nr:HPr family phosphocarrier protein [Acetobacterium paludosum]MBC3888085.1 HPr family phosphocarrier protein [Acetobacterium paludosum]